MTTLLNEDNPLRLACDCHVEECATWLKLTPDGFLLLEDKDGCQVSFLLPDWLDAAMRRALLADRQTEINQALPTVAIREAQPTDEVTL